MRFPDRRCHASGVKRCVLVSSSAAPPLPPLKPVRGDPDLEAAGPNAGLQESGLDWTVVRPAELRSH